MSLVKKILIGIAALAVLSYVLPALMISDNTERYRGDEGKYVRKALEDVRASKDLPTLHHFYVTKLVVRSLEPTGERDCPYVSTVESRTWLGLRLDDLNFTVKPGCQVKRT